MILQTTAQSLLDLHIYCWFGRGCVREVEAPLGTPHLKPELLLSPHPAMGAQPSHTAGPPSPTLDPPVRAATALASRLTLNRAPVEADDPSFVYLL